ncbi:TetR/AcrR family transcriptional regulator [Roseateles sp. SL47]|uniref:TetR/AcrR family transcriptional regulator n=1 Tax=Roseateles sp. SL47 TaxID=2995138 RepID=UPI00226DAE06|nr:TetR/AcrR family transcriptional regulator [Roseateles sp. SL47]WAC75079.1 TetR/AcrR family transcriptional regulator [Roseateles sp. SL47]
MPPPVPRKTREQSRLETRQRLLASAHAAIVRDGIGSLSLRGLCDQAGFSQGAFYSNFSSRDDLLLALMQRHVQDEVAALRRLVEASEGQALAQMLDHLALHLALLAKASHWSLLAAELQLHAQRDAAFAELYNLAKLGYHREFALLVEDLVRRHGLAPVMDPLQIAVGLYGLWLGLVIQGTVPGAQTRDEILLGFFRAVIGAPAATSAGPSA